MMLACCNLVFTRHFKFVTNDFLDVVITMSMNIDAHPEYRTISLSHVTLYVFIVTCNLCINSSEQHHERSKAKQNYPEMSYVLNITKKNATAQIK